MGGLHALGHSWEIEGGGGGGAASRGEVESLKWRVVVEPPAVFLDVGSPELSERAGIKM